MMYITTFNHIASAIKLFNEDKVIFFIALALCFIIAIVYEFYFKRADKL